MQENTGSYTHPVLKEHFLGITLVVKTQPKRLQDMVIVEHVRSNANPKFAINNNTKRSFDPRPSTQRCVSEGCKQCFLSKIKETLSGAVINILHPPTPSEDLPAPLCDLATEVSSKNKRIFRKIDTLKVVQGS